jgi:hypothetical protein
MLNQESCTLCGGAGHTEVTSKFAKSFKRTCKRCSGSGRLNLEHTISQLRSAQAIVEAGPAMDELTRATVALTDAIMVLEARSGE